MMAALLVKYCVAEHDYISSCVNFSTCNADRAH